MRPRHWMIVWLSLLMKLLLDQGLPYTAAALLRERGLDACHVEEIGYSLAEDGAIVEYARDEGRIVITLDSDFHALLALSHASTPSVVHIRMQGLRGADVADLLMMILRDWQTELEEGVALTVRGGRIRFRHLPLFSG